MVLVLLLVAAAWLVCSVFVYGLSFAHFQREYPMQARDMYVYDMAISVLLALTGPISWVLLFVIEKPGRHGLKFY